MSDEEKHHHHFHLFGHHDQKPDEVTEPVAPAAEYSEDAIPIEQTEYYDGPRRPSAYAADSGGPVVDQHDKDEAESEARLRAEKQEKEAKHKEHVGETIGVAAGAYAMYEEHKAKKDVGHATRHKIEAKIAEAVAVGAGGYALHEHHEEKEAEKEEEAHKKKHHFF